MFQRDYIMRMIEMMGDLARRIAELMDELSQMRLLDDECHRHCGVSLDVLQSLSTTSLLDMLDPKQRLYASELLYMRTTLFQMYEEEADELLLKCFRLLVSLWEEGALCELRGGRLKALKSQLMDRLNDGDLMLCAEFFFQASEFSEMEDAIFQAVDCAAGNDVTSYGMRGSELLREAAKANEHSLALARTSSHEMREAARELAEMMKMRDQP